jgi:hypothetical protein
LSFQAVVAYLSGLRMLRESYVRIRIETTELDWEKIPDIHARQIDKERTDAEWNASRSEIVVMILFNAVPRPGLRHYL